MCIVYQHANPPFGYIPSLSGYISVCGCGYRMCVPIGQWWWWGIFKAVCKIGYYCSVWAFTGADTEWCQHSLLCTHLLLLAPAITMFILSSALISRLCVDTVFLGTFIIFQIWGRGQRRICYFFFKPKWQQCRSYSVKVSEKSERYFSIIITAQF